MLALLGVRPRLGQPVVEAEGGEAGLPHHLVEPTVPDELVEVVERGVVADEADAADTVPDGERAALAVRLIPVDQAVAGETGLDAEAGGEAPGGAVAGVARVELEQGGDRGAELHRAGRVEVSRGITVGAAPHAKRTIGQEHRLGDEDLHAVRGGVAQDGAKPFRVRREEGREVARGRHGGGGQDGRGGQQGEGKLDHRAEPSHRARGPQCRRKTESRRYPPRAPKGSTPLAAPREQAAPRRPG